MLVLLYDFNSLCFISLIPRRIATQKHSVLYQHEVTQLRLNCGARREKMLDILVLCQGLIKGENMQSMQPSLSPIPPL